jgi:hypothetical protein
MTLTKSGKTRKAKNKPATHGVLDEETVKLIKKRIWWGETRADIAISMKGQVSISMLCNIGAGYRWGEIPWPDGSIGAMSAARSKLIKLAREAVMRDPQSVNILKAKLRSLSKPA